MVKEIVCERIAAAPPMNSHLLPCSCSRRIAVSTAQAGGEVRCPDCGARLAVPRLREFARLEPVPQESAVAVAGWNAARAAVLAGILVACGAAAVAGWLHGCRRGVASIDEPAIRASVAAADAARVHGAWLEFEHQGIAKSLAVDDQRRLQRAQALAGLETVAWLVAAVGAAFAAGAAIIGGRRLF